MASPAVGDPESLRRGWSVLLALSGYGYSAPQQRMTFLPRINNENFQCFFTTGAGWGRYQQQKRKESMSVRVEADYGLVQVVDFGEDLVLTEGGAVIVKLSRSPLSPSLDFER